MRSIPYVLGATALATCLTLASDARAAYQVGTRGNDVLIGKDDDKVEDLAIQVDPAAANQSLDRADTLIGLLGNDVLIGMGGSDTMIGDFGDDIFIGGIERGQRPNQDIQIGGSGNDVAIWQGGDGSDLFDGGVGDRDALVFATIDRDQNTNIPILSPVTGRHQDTGLPTADATNQGGFCEIEAVADPAARGFEFLVRFFNRNSGALLVTVRTRDVEQLYCTSEAGGAITFADLTVPNPTFVEVPLDEIEDLSTTVAKIVR
jgi:hypothetical protein